MFDYPIQITELPSWLDVSFGLDAPIQRADGYIDVCATVNAVRHVVPGPETQRIVATLAALPEADVTPAERVDLLVQFERCEAWLVAQKQRVLAAIDRDAGGKEERAKRTGRYEDTELEVGLAMSWSQGMVRDRLDVATELTERLPKTWSALARGDLIFWKAREIAVGAQKLSDPAKARRFEGRVLRKGSDQTFGDIRRAVVKALIEVDPEGAEGRRKQTRRERRVTRRPLEDGGGHIGVSGPAEMIAVIHSALTEGSRQLKTSGAVDNLDQGRFDTLFDWAVRYLDELAIPGRPATPVGATLIVKTSTAAGEDDDPAEIAGFGPITAQAARDLLHGRAPAPGPFDKWRHRFAPESYSRDEFDLDPSVRNEDGPPPDDDDLPPDDWEWQPPPEPQPQTPANRDGPPDPFTVAWRVLRVDSATGWAVPPPGVRLNHGTDRRFATPAQARYVRDRDRKCAVPTCAQSGQRVDIDHRTEASCGGVTDVGNLGPGCPHHNRTTRNRGWKIEPHDDETATLITPQGRRYRIRPHNYLD